MTSPQRYEIITHRPQQPPMLQYIYIVMASYTAFGLQIESELPLPGLLPGSNRPPDVHIRHGPVPTALPNPVGKSAYFHATFQATPDTFLLTVPDVARYLVVKGQEISIHRAPNCREDYLPLYLLGSAFGTLLHQRRLLVLHASCIQTNRGAVLFVGPSGHGKSTLLTALVDRGYAMMSDDVTAITMESASGPVAFSAYPRLRLSADAAARIDYPVEGLQRIRDAGKYLVPVTHFCADPLPVHAVYALNIHAAPNIQLAPVETAQRFALVGANTYRYAFLEGLGLRQVHFHAATRLAKTVHIGSITRPVSPFLLDELVDRLEVEFGGPTDNINVKEAS